MWGVVVVLIVTDGPLKCVWAVGPMSCRGESKRQTGRSETKQGLPPTQESELLVAACRA
jgi:hypothetical protein